MPQPALLPLPVALVLSALLPAQGLVFPSGHEKTTTDPGVALTPAVNTHVQFCYGSYQGSSRVATAKRLSFRREAVVGTANQARSWTNVALRVSDCDVTMLSDVYAANLMSPTLVFSASVSWPATTGKPTSNPPPFGQFAGASYDVSFPFSSTWLHLGKYGFAADFQFAGGQMGSATTRWQTYTVAGVADTNTAVLNTLANYGSATCRATGRTAASFLSAWMFSYNVPGGNKQFRLSLWGENYPSSTSFIGAVGVNGSTTGTPFLTSCQGLHVDFTQPVLLVPMKSDAVGFFWGPYRSALYSASLVGAKVWTQAAFDDQSVFQLTQGGATTIAAPPTATSEYAVRIYATQIGGYMPGAWGDLSDTAVPLVYLH